MGKNFAGIRSPRFLYTGKEYDYDTGLTHFDARVYDATTAHWLQRDPYNLATLQLPEQARGLVNLLDRKQEDFLLDAATQNGYGYVRNNPLRWRDLTGLRPLTPGEIGFLSHIFGNTVDYAEVEVYEAPVLNGGGVTLGNNIFFHPDLYKDDFASSKKKAQGDLVHEMMHVWQDQNLQEYTFLHAGMEHLQFRSPYDYVLEASKSLLDYGYEQQGRLVEDYYKYILNRVPDPPNEAKPLSDYTVVVRRTIRLRGAGSGSANTCE